MEDADAMDFGQRPRDLNRRHQVRNQPVVGRLLPHDCGQWKLVEERHDEVPAAVLQIAVLMDEREVAGVWELVIDGCECGDLVTQVALVYETRSGCDLDEDVNRVVPADSDVQLVTSVLV
jgi:hypothetical protein